MGSYEFLYNFLMELNGNIVILLNDVQAVL